jgi:hypothetical protein
LQHDARGADGAVVEQRFAQALDGITSKVLGDGQHAAVLLGQVDQPAAAAHGDRKRFFAQHVQAQRETLRGDHVVRTAVDGHVGGVESVDFAHHLLEVGGEDRRRRRAARRLRRRGAGLFAAQIADGD